MANKFDGVSLVECSACGCYVPPLEAKKNMVRREIGGTRGRLAFTRTGGTVRDSGNPYSKRGYVEESITYIPGERHYELVAEYLCDRCAKNSWRKTAVFLTLVAGFTFAVVHFVLGRGNIGQIQPSMRSFALEGKHSSMSADAVPGSGESERLPKSPALQEEADENLPPPLVGVIEGADWNYVRSTIKDIQQTQSRASVQWVNRASGWGGFVTLTGTALDDKGCKQFRITKNLDDRTTSGLLDYCAFRN